MRLTLKESICRTRQFPSDDSILLGRAELLGEDERDLIEAVFVRSQSSGSLARMMGVTESTIHRRVHRLCRRMTSNTFLDAARALPYLSQQDAILAKMRYCQGLSQRQLCRRLGLSYHALRRRLDQVGTRIDTIRRLTCKNRTSGDPKEAASAQTALL